MISDSGNTIATNAHGGNNRPLKVITFTQTFDGPTAVVREIEVSYHGAYSGTYTWKITGTGGIPSTKNFVVADPA